MAHSSRLALPPVAARQPETTPPPGKTGNALHDVEARHISELLQQYHDNRRQVASALGISERTLYRKLKRYHLN